jgi:HD-GYP domain-containing protein (c-di-GMP phosphodiesterase class II)
MLAEISKAIESRDPYARGHSARVTALADAVARWLGWSHDELRGLQIGGPLHDIGKLSVPGRILSKPGPLTAAERREIRKHPEAGARLIEPIESVHAAIPYVLHHHEQWDGSGYPHGLVGNEIPIEARVLAVADAFDAMTSHRPYRLPLDDERALGEIDRCAGAQFDPDVARAFVDVWGARGIRSSLADAAAL